MNGIVDLDKLIRDEGKNAFYKSLSKLRCRSLDGLHGKAPTGRDLRRIKKKGEDNRSKSESIRNTLKGFGR